MDLYSILWKITYEVFLVIGMTLAWVTIFLKLDSLARNPEERKDTKLRTIFFHVVTIIVLTIGIGVEFIVACISMNSLKGV